MMATTDPDVIIQELGQERYDLDKAEALRMQEKGSFSDLFDGDYEILFYMKRQLLNLA